MKKNCDDNNNDDNEDLNESSDDDNSTGNNEEIEVDIDETPEELIKTTIKTHGENPETKKLKCDNVDITNVDTSSNIRDVQLIAIEPGTIEDKEGFSCPCVYIWGRSSNGKSIQLICTEFFPYFYFETGFQVSEEELKIISVKFEEYLKKHQKKLEVKKKVVSVEQILNKSSLFGFSNETSVFIKVTLQLPAYIVPLRKFIEESEDFVLQGRSRFKTFESSFQYILRWIVDNRACGGGWIEFDPRDALFLGEKTSTCDEEYIIKTSKISCKSPDERSEHSPLKLFSFDIECAARPGQFPEATRDKVIQIAVTTEIFQKSKETNHTTIFVLRSCGEIQGSTVLSFEKEENLLSAFQEFIVNYDPDVVIGYNINNFDWPYLMKRAQTLRLKNFSLLSRRKEVYCQCKTATFQSKAHGLRESFEVNLFGRWTIDLLQEIQRNHKLRSYKLNSVAFRFLGKQKEDVHHSQITPLFNGSKEDRTVLAKYCLKDAELPLELLHQQMIIFNYLEMTRVTLVPPSFLSNRGQAIKVLTQIYFAAQTFNKLVPKSVTVDKNATYDGATVFNPVRGFHKRPIVTLDFSSLYPSIMISNNLCYSTIKKSPDETTITTPIGAHFVTSEHFEGLLPFILKRLLSRRKIAKEDLAKETDPGKKAILDGRQLALKVSANSVYGFTGATVGKLPCLEISASVTSIGRQMIGRTAELVCKRYSRKNGFEHDAKLIYGDTDSVMIDFGVETIEEALKLGKEAAAYVTEFFKKPVRLEFEKVYFPYLLINKKRYAGLFWTNAEKPDKLDAKGIESVRRDNCKLLSKTVKECIQRMLDKSSPELAAEYVKNVIRKLLMSEIDISDLVITKKLSQSPEQYKTKAPHVELALKLFKRNPATAPRVGDRVPYVLVKGNKKQKSTDLAEDPLFVINNGLDIDYKRYIETCFRKPIERIFGPLMKNTEVLFQGEHTMSSRSLPKPLSVSKNTGIHGKKIEIEYEPESNGKKKNNRKQNCNNKTSSSSSATVAKISQQTSIFSVFKKQERCKICKNPTHSSNIICKNCSEHSEQIRSGLTSEKVKTKNLIEDMKKKCLECTGSSDTLETCSSFDCEQFYSRFLAKYRLEGIEEDLRKLSF